MVSPVRLELILLALLSYAPVAISQDDARQTLFLGSQFSAQASCVRDCFVSKDTTGACWYDLVGKALGCMNTAGCAVSMGGTTWAAVNECYCRSDMQPVAQMAISTCITASCMSGNVNVNLASGSALYRDYCSSISLPANAEASTTVANSGYVLVITTFALSNREISPKPGATFRDLLRVDSVPLSRIFEIEVN
jgi:hypothetical protein